VSSVRSAVGGPGFRQHGRSAVFGTFCV